MTSEVCGVHIADSPVIIGGAQYIQPASDAAAAAVSDSEVSTCIVGLTYTSDNSPQMHHMTSASSLPSLLTHDNDDVVR